MLCGSCIQPKKQFKVQIIDILEEIDSFCWPKMHFWKVDKKFGRGPPPWCIGRRTFRLGSKSFFLFDFQKWGNVTTDFWQFFSFSTKSRPKMTNEGKIGQNPLKISIFEIFIFFTLLKYFFVLIMIQNINKAHAKWIG